jgi:hypothetical protein
MLCELVVQVGVRIKLCELEGDQDKRKETKRRNEAHSPGKGGSSSKARFHHNGDGQDSRAGGVTREGSKKEQRKKEIDERSFETTHGPTISFDYHVVQTTCISHIPTLAT